MRSSLILSSVLAATALVVGCEWTTSDGISWDDNYNVVNFSGTYAISPVSSSSSSESSSESTAVTKGVTKSGGSATSGAVSPTPAAGTTYTISGNVATAYDSKGKVKTTTTFTLSGNVGETATAGGIVTSGVLNSSGGWSITVDTAAITDYAGGSPVSNVSISYSTTSVTTSTSSSSSSSSVTATSITVHQSGQNVTMTMNNGNTFTGKISGFDYNAETVEASSVVIAKYNVSGAYGSLTGTLNSGTATRTIDGVWNSRSGSNSFSGTCAGAGRSVSANATATIDAE